MTIDADRRQAELRREVARHVVHEAATALAGVGVVCAPMKGALLSALVPDFRRPFCDVDILVPAAQRHQAVRRLEEIGYVRTGTQPFATSLLRPGHPLPLDVHHQLFPPGLFRLDAAGALARARSDDASFGAPVRLLAGLDVYALAVGGFAKDRLGAAHGARLAELGLVAAHFGLGAPEAARHLSRHGLGRASRYVLELAGRRGDRFADAVLRELPADAIAPLVIEAAVRWLSHADSSSPWSAPAAHLLNESLGRGVRSLAAHAAEAVPRRLGFRGFRRG